MCATNTFLNDLDSDEQSDTVYDFDDATDRTVWSNLPASTTRNGLAFEDMDDSTLADAMSVAKAVLSDDGYEDFLGILAADDYLNASGGGSAYGSGLYFIAVFGTPSTSGNWALQIGGHHLAYNFTFVAGTAYPVPNFIGAEPKSSFEINSTTYAPMADEGDALVAMFDDLTSTELSSAYLSGESYSDVLVGPDNGSGTMPDDYPTGSERRGVLVSDLDDDQQALVIAAIKQWVSDFNADDDADALLEAYTTADALADTYIAWAGTESKGVDVDTAGTYMRIDGPRLWIELVCQNGVVFTSTTHYHSIYRDKTMDYGDSL
ncbi:DUF3500 domain-containing protein [Gallaecimonas mangrovi]|uniref:DUF3500 domain-containing protein n=1 Tax=Gallaecimonas mangrovi TaxID=2291597 RepID=UPI00186762FF|nr:DUF3500 domain-containing protein [Gallaecimonas mangrovi]